MSRTAAHSPGARETLRAALALAAACLRTLPAELAFAAADDPLRLDLPPLLAPGAEIDPAALRATGALYLQAELEQTGLLAMAERLAAAAPELALPIAAARRLDELARHARDSYDAGRRQRLFAALFGLGPAATLEQGSAVNRGFEQVFAACCAAAVRAGLAAGFASPADTSLDAMVRRAAVALVLNLAPRQNGSVLFAGRRIGEQLQRAVEILGDPAVGALVGGRGLWDTLRKLQGDGAPDLGRRVTRGRSGLALFNALAGLLPELAAAPPRRPLLAAGSPAFSQAAQWLAATGLTVLPAAERWPA